MMQSATKDTCLAFVSSLSRSPLTYHDQNAFRKRARLHSMSMAQQCRSSQQQAPLSRRAVLLSMAFSASLLLPSDMQALAYSSPYKPGKTAEQALPERLYESEVNRVVTTPSGLQYFDILPGSGTQASPGDTVLVYYTSRLRGLYGIKITSTYDDPTSPPYSLKLGSNDVVPGVSEAITGMKVGGKRRAVLPPSIGYKNPDMKPAVKDFFARRRLLSVLETNRDATIVFDFELVKVK